MSGLLPLSRPHIRNMPAKKLIKKPTIAVPLFMIVSQARTRQVGRVRAFPVTNVLAEKRSCAARAGRESDVGEPSDVRVTPRLTVKISRSAGSDSRRAVDAA